MRLKEQQTPASQADAARPRGEEHSICRFFSRRDPDPRSASTPGDKIPEKSINYDQSELCFKTTLTSHTFAFSE